MKILIINDGSEYLKELVRKINSGEIKFELTNRAVIEEIPPIPIIRECTELIIEEKHPDVTGYYNRQTRSNKHRRQQQ